MTMILRLSVLAVAGFVFATDAWADGESTPHRHTLAAPTRESLKVGARCVVEVKAKPHSGGTEAKVVYEGVITRLDNEGVGLIVERRERRTVKAKRLMKKTPLLDRWLGRNIGVAVYLPDAEVGEDAFLPNLYIDSLNMVVEQPRDGAAGPDHGPESSSKGNGRD